MKRHLPNTEKGSVLFLILLGIILLGALSFAVSDSGRTGSGRDKEDKTLALNTALSYAVDLENAISLVMAANKCADTTLNFASAKWATPAPYVNPNAPVSKICDIFDSAGGGVTWQDPPSAIKKTGGSEYLITGNIRINGVGTNSAAPVGAGAELLFISYIPLESCQLINQRMGIASGVGGVPPEFSESAIAIPPASTQPFGVNALFTNGQHAGLSTAPSPNASQISGKATGCYKATDTGKYLLYHVLLAR